MAVKKKKQQFPANKEAKDSRSYYTVDLPHQLTEWMARQSALEQSINFGRVTKSWRAATRKCNPDTKLPWLQLSDTKDRNSDDQQCNHEDKYPNNYVRHHSVPEWCRGKPASWLRISHLHQWESYLGCSNGVMLAKGETPSAYFLWDPAKPTKISTYCLPPWDVTIRFSCAAQTTSSSPSDPACNIDCMVLLVLTGTSHPAFVFHRLINRGMRGVEHEWIKQDCTLIDPQTASNESQQQYYMQFTNAIGFKGKFYALSLQGTLAVIEVVDSLLQITALGTRRAVPTVSSRHFREYLLESDGEILLIFLISKKSVQVVDDVEVFRLNLLRLSWIKMQSLGDQTLFLGENFCVSVSASKVGCQSNCLYFHVINNEIDGWWLYDMERGNISPGWSTDNNCKTKSPVWEEPVMDE